MDLLRVVAIANTHSSVNDRVDVNENRKKRRDDCKDKGTRGIIAGRRRISHDVSHRGFARGCAFVIRR